MKNKRRSSDDVSCSPISVRPQDDLADGPLNAGPTSGRSYRSKRTVLTRNACIRCRAAKTKCNGKHPSCARCQAGGVQCVYDVTSEGITKMQDLQQKLESKSQDLIRAMTIINVMQQGSDQDATEILARLRLGDPLQKVADALETKAPFATAHHPMVPPVLMQRSQTLPPTPLEPGSGYPAYSTPTKTSPSPSARRDSVCPMPTAPQASQQDFVRHVLTPSPTNSEESFRSFPQITFANCTWPGSSGECVVAEMPTVGIHPTYEPLITHEQMTAAKNTARATKY